LLGCSDRVTRAWATDKSTVPTEIAAWLEAWVANRRDHPDPLPPENWRRGACIR
jgi:hypothetical protein